MSKRRHEETKEERWSRKMKKYESKLIQKQRRNSRRILSSDDEDVYPEEHLEPEVSIFLDQEGLNNDYTDQSTIPTNIEVETSADVLAADGTDVPAAASVTDVPSAADIDIFDAELLQALGEPEPEPVEYGVDLHIDIATRLQKKLVSGLNKETREDLTKKYLFPKNTPFLKAPTLNPEIQAMLAEPCRLRDKRLLTKQDQLGRALTALGNAMTALLKNNPVIPEVVRTLNDAGKLLADSHHMESDTRRSVIIPLVEKSLADTFKNRERDSFLFGESLDELVKKSRVIKKTSELIQAVASTSGTASSSALNYKGPSTRRRQWVGQTYPQHRFGGPPRATYPSRRRGTSAAAAPPARRQPPPLRRQPAQRQRAADRPQK